MKKWFIQNVQKKLWYKNEQTGSKLDFKHSVVRDKLAFLSACLKTFPFTND